MYPSVWYQTLRELGWSMSTRTYQESARGELPPVIAKGVGAVAVFCMPISKNPYDAEDPLARRTCDHIAQLLGESWLRPALLLMKQSPLHSIQGKTYGYVGMAYLQNE